VREGLGAIGVAVVAVVCCAGLPLLATAGLSAAAYGLIGGVAAGVIALAAVVAIVVVRARRRANCAVPSTTAEEVRHGARLLRSREARR
jgi:hypothetical protein